MGLKIKGLKTNESKKEMGSKQMSLKRPEILFFFFNVA